jgi:hypothetical protein
MVPVVNARGAAQVALPLGNWPRKAELAQRAMTTDAPSVFDVPTMQNGPATLLREIWATIVTDLRGQARGQRGGLIQMQ